MLDCDTTPKKTGIPPGEKVNSARINTGDIRMADNDKTKRDLEIIVSNMAVEASNLRIEIMKIEVQIQTIVEHREKVVKIIGGI